MVELLSGRRFWGPSAAPGHDCCARRRRSAGRRGGPPALAGDLQPRRERHPNTFGRAIVADKQTPPLFRSTDSVDRIGGAHNLDVECLATPDELQLADVGPGDRRCRASSPIPGSPRDVRHPPRPGDVGPPVVSSRGPAHARAQRPAGDRALREGRPRHARRSGEGDDRGARHRREPVGTLPRVAPADSEFPSAPGRIRTPDRRLRRPLLYPAELQAPDSEPAPACRRRRELTR